MQPENMKHYIWGNYAETSSYSHDILAAQISQIRNLLLQACPVQRNCCSPQDQSSTKASEGSGFGSRKRCLKLAHSLANWRSWILSAQSAFIDAISLRYSWPLQMLPSSCACGANLNTEHAFLCRKGDFPLLRHNEIRYITVNLLTECCHDVCVEANVQPLTGEFRRIFNPYAPSYNTISLVSSYTRHEKMKKREYDQRVREIEHATLPHLSCQQCHRYHDHWITLFRLHLHFVLHIFSIFHLYLYCLQSVHSIWFLILKKKTANLKPSYTLTPARATKCSMSSDAFAAFTSPTESLERPRTWAAL